MSNAVQVNIFLHLNINEKNKCESDSFNEGSVQIVIIENYSS